MFSSLIAYVIHKPRRTLSGFLRVFWELYGSKVQFAPPHGNFINCVANPEITYKLLLFQILLTDTFLNKKNAYFDRNLLHFNGTGMARKQPFESFFEKWIFWVVSCLGLDAFLPIWVLFALDFVVILLEWLPQEEILEENISTFILSKRRNLRETNMTTQFLWSFLTNRFLSPETSSKTG